MGREAQKFACALPGAEALRAAAPTAGGKLPATKRPPCRVGNLGVAPSGLAGDSRERQRQIRSCLARIRAAQPVRLGKTATARGGGGACARQTLANYRRWLFLARYKFSPPRNRTEKPQANSAVKIAESAPLRYNAKLEDSRLRPQLARRLPPMNARARKRDAGRKCQKKYPVNSIILRL